MIIIPLQGGLGNQLFQYAFGRYLEHKLQAKVAFDPTFFDNPGKYTKRKYALGVFAVDLKLANSEEVASVKFPFGALSKILYMARKGLNKYVWKKYNTGYTEGLVESLSAEKSSYVEGYFQSFEYALPILETLKKDFVLRESPSESLLRLIGDVQTNHSVLVHIRRGDYGSPSSGKKQELSSLDKSYYVDAINYIRNQRGDVSVCVYTDDVEMVKQEFGELFGEKCIYASSYGLSDYEEFYSMRFASHFIIANSSFSWWGALLAENNDAIVVAPKDWRNVYFTDTTHLCPKEWVLV